MSRGLPKLVKSYLGKARESALQAVALYNNPLASFRSGAFIVLMIIAWTSLLLAIFLRRRLKPYHRERGGNHFVRVDGDPKPWELSTCLDKYWGSDNNSMRKNLEFFIALRHKIEHRDMPELDINIFGECQAMLFNFEDMMEREFGEKYALTESLSISLQFSRIRQGDKADAVRRAMRPVTKDVADFVERFRSSLSGDIFSDMAFSYKVFLLPNVAGHRSKDDLAVEFVRYDREDKGQQDVMRRVAALVKDRHVPVANVGKLRATEVKQQVAAAVAPKCFNQHHHMLCWRHYRVRPSGGSPDPQATNPKYCVYDALHRDYAYTEEWVQFLIDKMKDDEEYARVLQQRRARPPDSGTPV